MINEKAWSFSLYLPTHLYIPMGAPGATDSGETKNKKQKLQAVSVTGAMGQIQQQGFLQLLVSQTIDLKLSHSFLYMPEYPISLLGRDFI